MEPSRGATRSSGTGARFRAGFSDPLSDRGDPTMERWRTVQVHRVTELRPEGVIATSNDLFCSGHEICMKCQVIHVLRLGYCGKAAPSWESSPQSWDYHYHWYSIARQQNVSSNSGIGRYLSYLRPAIKQVRESVPHKILGR